MWKKEKEERRRGSEGWRGEAAGHRRREVERDFTSPIFLASPGTRHVSEEIFRCFQPWPPSDCHSVRDPGKTHPAELLDTQNHEK